MYNSSMIDIILSVIIVVQFLFIVYSDIQNRKERDSLELKIMSGSIHEYRQAVEETDLSSAKLPEDPYLDIENAGIEQILKSKETR